MPYLLEEPLGRIGGVQIDQPIAVFWLRRVPHALGQVAVRIDEGKAPLPAVKS